MSFETMMVGMLFEAIIIVGFLVMGYAIGAKGTEEIKKECEHVDRNKIIDSLITTLQDMKDEGEEQI